MRSVIQRLLFATCLLLPLATLAASLPEPPKGIRIYDKGLAPDFSLPDIDGDRIQLSDFRGRWVFLHFWASWCGPCREELPTITSLSRQFDDRRLKIIMVNTAEDEDTIFSFTSEVSLELPNYMDRDGAVTEQWKPRGLPTTFLVDPDGMIRYQAIGGRDWVMDEYRRFIETLLAHQRKL